MLTGSKGSWPCSWENHYGRVCEIHGVRLLLQVMEEEKEEEAVLLSNSTTSVCVCVSLCVCVFEDTISRKGT